MNRRQSIIVAALLALAGCGGGERPVPRPAAFVRIEPYDAVFHELDSVPVHFLVNDSAVIVPDGRRAPAGSRWVTLAYPRYGAALVYLTFTPVTSSSAGDVVENRIERMSLNSGGGRSELTEFTSDGGFACRLLSTPAGTVTPVQFIAASPRLVVSGALFLKGAASASSPDSLAPVVSAVSRDLVHALRHLK